MFKKLKIDSSSTNEEVDVQIENNGNYYEEQIRAIANDIKTGTKISSIKNDINKTFNNEYFTNIVVEDINKVLSPFVECTFLRKLSIKKFKEIFVYSLDNMFIKLELPIDVQKELSITKDEYNYLNKFLSTICGQYFVYRKTKKYFAKTMYDMFGFDDNKIDIIVEILENKKEIIKECIMFDIVDNIYDFSRFIYNAFQD